MPLLRRRGNTPSEPKAPDPDDTAAQDASGHDDIEPPPPERETSVDRDTDTTPNTTTTSAASATPTPSEQPWSRASTTTRPDTPPVQEETGRHKRFSLLRFRNASDPQLSLRAKQQAEKPPPVPRPPEIITTAPTGEFQGPRKKTSRMSLVAAKLRGSSEISRDPSDSTNDLSASYPRPPRKSLAEQRARPTLATLEEPLPLPTLQPTNTGPAANANSSAAAPTLVNRQSESSRSDVSSNDHHSHQSPATTPRKSPGGNPFFKMRRSKKPPEPLFPLSHLPQKDKSAFTSQASLPGTSNQTSTPRPSSVRSSNVSRAPTDRSGPPPAAALFGQGSRSGHSSPTRPMFVRARSSTMSSAGGGRDSEEHHLAPTTRTSTSTGRKSFGDLLGLTRLRQNSELSRQGTMTPTTPASAASKNNSFQIARDSISLPERREDESAAKYLGRVEDIARRGVIAATLSKNSDPFSAAVLRSYMRSFSFFEDPMDMAIRKLLMEAELPKETQQIDRCLQAFANRYHECNPGIYSSPDQAYFIAFSLLILHTDVFNKNNKYKMQKPDYLKNTRGEGVFDEVLEYFYDNISYTPFIHVEDEIDLGDRASSKAKRKNLLAAANDPAKRAAKEPIDPYTLILDGNLDALRPNLRDAMLLDDHYNYLGTATSLDLRNLQETFFRTGVLQIVSARSRPDAFMTEKTATNPEGAGPGIVDIKVTKVGLLWRKELKKRRTRSPWQEWGAILTGAQLYFFRNTGWVKSLMHQRETHVKAGHDGTPIIFKPPLEQFKPDGLMSTDGAVALHDTSYKKHKNAFVYVRQGGLDEVLLADTEDEMNDWLAKLNYAAAFRTSGVRMRGVVGAHYDGQGRRGIRRLDGTDAAQVIDTPSGQVSVARGHIDHQEAEDIQTARRNFMHQKIEETEEKIKVLQKQLDEQLRNARHLLILAPIQPRTREQLLTSAARLSAQIKWTRVEIWRETCHRDILNKDLDDENPTPLTRASPLVASDPSMSPRTRLSSPARSASRHKAKASERRGSAKTTETLSGLRISVPSSQNEGPAESPGDNLFETPPQSAVDPHDRRESHDETATQADSMTAPDMTTASPPGSPSLTQKESPSKSDGRRASKTSQNQDDVDAEERELLQQAGLIEHRTDKDSEKATVSTAADGADVGSPADRTKIRRSLQRTLREGAGHLSHHRSSRRGRAEGQIVGSTPSEDAISESSVLPRSNGSFVVHGKKASVINFGSELQYLPTDEKIRSRKSVQHTENPLQEQGHQPLSPTLSAGDDDDFYSATGDLEDERSQSRRASAASASTATARSFRELHRKYSANNARRSISNSGLGRLRIPSDGESEAAVSFSDGRRSPLPPMETEENEDEEDDDEDDDEDDEEDEDDATSSKAPSSKMETPRKKPGVTGSPGKGNKSVEELRVQADRPASQERRSLQPVNA